MSYEILKFKQGGRMLRRIISLINRKTRFKAHLHLVYATLGAEWPFLHRGLRTFRSKLRNLRTPTIEKRSSWDAPFQTPAYFNSNTFPRPPELAKLREEIAALDSKIKISLLIPTFNTQPNQIHELLESLRNQVFENWEACFVDDCSSDQQLKEFLAQAANADTRIKFAALAERSGISIATNRALAMASGQLVALVDHDDVLLPNALAEVVIARNKSPSAQMFYSDLAMIDYLGNVQSIVKKPDWSPEFFLSTCYTTHLRVFTSDILREVGGFRISCEAAQDIDLICRVTSKTNEICHIPKVLYYWRITESSVTSGVSAKPHIIRNTLTAYNEFLCQKGSSFRNIFPNQFRSAGMGAFKLDFSNCLGSINLIQIFPHGLAASEIHVRNFVVENAMPASHQFVFVPRPAYEAKKLAERYSEPEISIVPYENYSQISSYFPAMHARFSIFIVGAFQPKSDMWWREMVGYLQLDRQIGLVCGKSIPYTEGRAVRWPTFFPNIRFDETYSDVGERGAAELFPQNPRSLNPLCFAVRTASLLKSKLDFGEHGASAPFQFTQKLLGLKFRIVYNPWAEIDISDCAVREYAQSLKLYENLGGKDV